MVHLRSTGTPPPHVLTIGFIVGIMLRSVNRFPISPRPVLPTAPRRSIGSMGKLHDTVPRSVGAQHTSGGQGAASGTSKSRTVIVSRRHGRGPQGPRHDGSATAPPPVPLGTLIAGSSRLPLGAPHGVASESRTMAGSRRHNRGPDGPLHGGSASTPPPFLLRFPKGAHLANRTRTTHPLPFASCDLPVPQFTHNRLAFATKI